MDVQPHAFETLPWRSSTRRDRHVTSYRATVPPFLAAQSIAMRDQTLELCRRAAIDVALLEHEVGDRLTSLEPFLLRTEAVASSKIEGEVASADQLARAQAGLGASTMARSVLAASNGLAALVAAASNGIHMDDVLEAHRKLMQDDPVDSRYAGRLRDMQNWIGGSDYSPAGAVHVPPQPSRVSALMDDLVGFANQRTGDPVVQAALVHAQFESIHPFTDGNGRIGRSLINAIWRHREVTRQVTVPVASAIVARQDEYFRLLNAFREGYLQPFVEFLALATSAAAQQARDSAAHIVALPAQWRSTVRPREGSSASRLIDLLIQHPVVNIDDVQALTGASQSSAYDAVARLEGAGILRTITESRRQRTWAAGEVLDEVDALVDRLRVRAG